MQFESIIRWHKPKKYNIINLNNKNSYGKKNFLFTVSAGKECC